MSVFLLGPAPAAVDNSSQILACSLHCPAAVARPIAFVAASLAAISWALS
jgi:precorrin isomerase